MSTLDEAKRNAQARYQQQIEELRAQQAEEEDGKRAVAEFLRELKAQGIPPHPIYKVNFHDDHLDRFSRWLVNKGWRDIKHVPTFVASGWVIMCHHYTDGGSSWDFKLLATDGRSFEVSDPFELQDVYRDSFKRRQWVRAYQTTKQVNMEMLRIPGTTDPIVSQYVRETSIGNGPLLINALGEYLAAAVVGRPIHKGFIY